MKGKQIKQIIKEAINSLKRNKLNEQVIPDEGCENLQAYGGDSAVMCGAYLAGNLMPASQADYFAEFYNLEYCCQGFEAGPNIYDEITEDNPCYVCASSFTSSNPVLQAQAQSLADENGILTMDINTALNFPNMFTNPPTPNSEFIGFNGQCSSTLNAPNPGGGTLGTSVSGNVYYEVEQASCTPSPTTGGPTPGPLDWIGTAPVTPTGIVTGMPGKPSGPGNKGPISPSQAGGIAAKPTRTPKINEAKRTIREAINKLKRKQLRKQLNEQLFQAPIAGTCDSNLYMTIDSIADVPDVSGNDYNNFYQLGLSIPENSTIKIAVNLIDTLIPGFNPTQQALNQYEEQDMGYFAFEPQISDFSQPWNPEYIYLTTGEPQNALNAFGGVWNWCRYNDIMANNISNQAGGGTGYTTDCNDLDLSQGGSMYGSSLANYPNEWAQACSSNDYTILQGTMGGIDMTSGNAQSSMNFYCTCPQIQSIDSGPTGPTTPPDTFGVAPTTPIGMVTGMPGKPTVDKFGSNVSPVGMAPKMPRGKMPNRKMPNRGMMREQVERMQKLANIKNKK